MRLALPILILALLGLAPRPSLAQEAAPVVDLQTVDVPMDAEAPRKSAFGRVMDLMIATLVEQHGGQDHARKTPRAASLALDSVPASNGEARRRASRGATTKIDIALGERFALPPTDAVSRVDLPR
jgi:hypothetical protein